MKCTQISRLPLLLNRTVWHEVASTLHSPTAAGRGQVVAASLRQGQGSSPVPSTPALVTLLPSFLAPVSIHLSTLLRPHGKLLNITSEAVDD